MKMKAAQGMLMHHKLAKYKPVAQIVLLGNLTWLEISAQQLLVYLWKSRAIQITGVYCRITKSINV